MSTKHGVAAVVLVAAMWPLGSGCTPKAVVNRAVACSFFPEQEPAACERRDDGRLVVLPRSLARRDFGPDGVSAITVQNALYFVSRRGETAPAFTFDNGPDYFVEGLARTVRNGKIGFVGPSLTVVVEPAWDFAFPFSEGVAVVCTGCAPAASAPGEEHAAVAGGKWGYIDKRGRVILPVTHERDALPDVQAAVQAAAKR